MSEERVSLRSRTFQLLGAAIIGAFASWLFDIYRTLTDLPSQIFWIIFSVIFLLILSFVIASIIGWVGNRKRVPKKEEEQGKLVKKEKIDKDIELLKIQIYSSEINTKSFTYVSVSWSVLLASMILILGLLYDEKITTLESVITFFFVLALVLILVELIHRRLGKERRKIQDMIKKIKKGELLSDLDKMGK